TLNHADVEVNPTMLPNTLRFSFRDSTLLRARTMPALLKVPRGSIPQAVRFARSVGDATSTQNRPAFKPNRSWHVVLLRRVASPSCSRSQSPRPMQLVSASRMEARWNIDWQRQQKRLRRRIGLDLDHRSGIRS